MIEVTLTVNQSNQRFDKVLKKILKNAPDSFIYKMLRKKNITLNGEKALGNEKTVSGDSVQFWLSQETFEKMRGTGTAFAQANVDFPEIQILYEDNDVCIFVKPVGILSQKAVDADFSINEWVIWHAVEKGIITGSEYESFRPSVVNRLDRNTSGIMCAGLSTLGLQELSKMFHDRTVHKYYYALVKGQLTEPDEMHGFLLKNEHTNQVRVFRYHVKDSREIHTRFTPVRVASDRTLLSVELLTGRSHQIRAHFASIGHPLLGDPKYGDNEWNLKNACYLQCLNAYKVVFPECGIPGISGKTFQTEVPKTWALGQAEA